ncbi:dihydrofolate reductase family protein [Zooshikella ganghwensis]|uniref:dihydrofolate reductase family protein n=1 Tax=Zooshikella ganghwensis TaxID=202772 RepID=UPI001B7F7F05|nr:dihydrofolate reductase family protein [Zooshikella ganghwensis]
MEKQASFNLPAEQWPYGQIPIFVLSHSIKGASEIIKDKIEMFSEEIPILITQLKSKGFQHAYIDGGSTITSFLNLELINEITITQAPVLLGNGIPLFGKTKSHIKLEDAQAKEYPNDFIQIKYKVKYL